MKEEVRYQSLGNYANFLLSKTLSLLSILSLPVITFLGPLPQNIKQNFTVQLQFR